MSPPLSGVAGRTAALEGADPVHALSAVEAGVGPAVVQVCLAQGALGAGGAGAREVTHLGRRGVSRE